ncbi:hypothetical protein AAG565_15480 [Fontimonas sp. SYSU GA230001]|uniref:hypothetical protein n=1 Tax=Fontimonas sp. SYSU GA230001 TaxID=3142450 RepID=UPI0032B58F21
MSILLGRVGPGLAQDVPEFKAPKDAASVGRSLRYYGIEDSVEQRASARFVLASANLDQVRAVPSPALAATSLFLYVFFGGGGAPADLVDVPDDLVTRFSREGADTVLSNPEMSLKGGSE